MLDEPTAALGVKETGQVLNLIQQIKAKGLPVILISHNMPNVFEVSDRIHIARLGGCAGVITPKTHTPTEAVAIMTGATTLQRGLTGFVNETGHRRQDPTPDLCRL